MRYRKIEPIGDGKWASVHYTYGGSQITETIEEMFPEADYIYVVDQRPPRSAARYEVRWQNPFGFSKNRSFKTLADAEFFVNYLKVKGRKVYDLWKHVEYDTYNEEVETY